MNCRGYFGSFEGGVGAFDEDFGTFHRQSDCLLLLFFLKLILSYLTLMFLCESIDAIFLFFSSLKLHLLTTSAILGVFLI
jgi:hypothetical protein